jgi:hypothetical protein
MFSIAEYWWRKCHRSSLQHRSPNCEKHVGYVMSPECGPCYYNLVFCTLPCSCGLFFIFPRKFLFCGLEVHLAEVWDSCYSVSMWTCFLLSPEFIFIYTGWKRGPRCSSKSHQTRSDNWWDRQNRARGYNCCWCKPPSFSLLILILRICNSPHSA